MRLRRAARCKGVLCADLRLCTDDFRVHRRTLGNSWGRCSRHFSDECGVDVLATLDVLVELDYERQSVVRVVGDLVFLRECRAGGINDACNLVYDIELMLLEKPLVPWR